MIDIKERNRQIVQQYKNGTDVNEIGKRFNISPMAVYQVVYRMKDKQHRYIENEIYQSLLSVCSERDASGLANALRRGGIMTVQQLKDTDINIISNMNSIGRSRVKIVRKFKSL